MAKDKKRIQPSSSYLLCSPDCCFIGVELGSLSSIFQWASSDTTGTTDEDELLLGEPRDCRQTETKKQQYHQVQHGRRYPLSSYWNKQTTRSDEHPPSVIALSRSSHSNSSQSTTSNLDLTVDGDDRSICMGIEHSNSGFNAIIAGLSKSLSKESYCPGEERDVVPLLNSENTFSCQHEHNYAEQHELLLSSLFADAQMRISLREDNTNTSVIGITTPETKKYVSSHSPKLRSDSISKFSKASTTCGSIGNSRYSGSSRSSGLHPSAHRFKRRLKGNKRCKVRTLPLLAGKKISNHKTTNIASSNRRSYSALTPPRKRRNITINSHNTDDYSSIASSHNTPKLDMTNTASQFLQGDCNLQKDEGRGQEIGSCIVAYGQEMAMQKLIEKMDTLAELEREGPWSNAVLSRVPAKVFALSTKGGRDRFVETRSIMSLKVGFLTMKYGLLVHWNTHTGLAELILLRKKCSDSFMVPQTKKTAKGKTAYGRRRSLGNSSSISISPVPRNSQTPSFVTVNSIRSSFDSDVASLGSFESATEGRHGKPSKESKKKRKTLFYMM